MGEQSYGGQLLSAFEARRKLSVANSRTTAFLPPSGSGRSRSSGVYAFQSPVGNNILKLPSLSKNGPWSICEERISSGSSADHPAGTETTTLALMTSPGNLRSIFQAKIFPISNLPPLESRGSSPPVHQQYGAPRVH